METLPRLFCTVTERYYHDHRPAYMYKKDGKYHGVTFAKLRDDVEAYAVALEILGIESGDRVGIISENRYEWVLTDFAVLLAGGVDVPTFPTLAAKQVSFILNHSQATMCAVSTAFQLNKLLSVIDQLETIEAIVVFDDVELPSTNKVRLYKLRQLLDLGRDKISMSDRNSKITEFLQRSQADDLCTIIYTSGTTGDPKGVMLTHRNILSNVEACRKVIEVSEHDVFLSYLPMCHAYERTTGFYTAFASGATTAFAESLDTIRTNLQEVRPTLMTSVPQLFERVRNGIYTRMQKESPLRQAIFRWALQIGEKWLDGKRTFMLRSQYKLADTLVFSKIRSAMGGRLRMLISGGGALSPEVNCFFWIIGLPILEGYGLTEAAPVLTVNRLDDNEFGTVGKPLPGVEIRIDDSDEIQARGPNIMRGYWRNLEATAQVLDNEGWLHTGDIGCWTERGNLKITDRIKNIIVTSGGKNVAPQHVENALLRSPLVEQVIVLGDGRPFCVAVIVPNLELLRIYIREQGLDSNKTDEQLCTDSAVQELVLQHLQQYQRDLAKYERVRRIALVPKPFTVENGLITPTMKVRRRQVEERYQAVIEALYANGTTSS